MMNSNGDNKQLCLTPDVMSSQSVSLSDVHTVLILFAYMAQMLSKSWPWKLYISRVCHSLSLCILSNAFSWSTNTMFSSLSCSVTFCSVVLRRKLGLCSPFLFWNPSVPYWGIVLLCTLFVVPGLWHTFCPHDLVGRCLCTFHSLFCCLSSSILVLWLLTASRLRLFFHSMLFGK